MPTEAYISVAVIGAIVASAAFVGLGTLIGLHRAARRGPSAAERHSPQPAEKSKIAAPAAGELKQCLHLADCIARDADLLSAMAAKPAPPSQRELESALAQLLKTIRGLSARLERLGSGEVTAEEDALETPPPHDVTTKADSRPLDRSAEFDDRKFPRTACPGSFKATIYPPPSKPESQPVQCTLLTRDISCGGIGIAHSEELYPKQIIVLHAVTKLLIGEVRWCRRVSERSYIAGCQLIKASG